MRLTDLLARPTTSLSDFSFKSYNLGTSGYITLKESSNLISRGTTGLTVWQASFYFVEWLLASTMLQELSGKSVLELGCGLGFVGVAVCRLCEGCRYIFTDCHEHVLEKLQENVTLNLKGSCKVLSLDWKEERSAAEVAASLDTNLDYIFATDVIYDREIIGYFIQTLGVFFRCYPDLKVFVTSTIRNGDTYKCFLQELEKEKFHWERLEDSETIKELFYYDRTQNVENIKITLLAS